MRSSDSLGTSESLNGKLIRSSSSTSSGARPLSNSRIDERCISFNRFRPASSSGAHLLQQLADHAADPHDLRRLVDKIGDGLVVVLIGALARFTAGHGHPL